MHSPEVKEKFIELRAKGYTFDSISQTLEVSKPTLIDWSKDFETNIQINNLRAIETESMQEQFLVGKRKRIEFLSNELSRIRTELNKRDLARVPTEKLFFLQLKYVALLKAEEIPIKITETAPDIDYMLRPKTNTFEV